MDTVTILRDLWRRRLFVAIVLVAALLAGAMVKYKLPGLQSRSYEVGVATTHILVDTPSSQVVNVSPKGSDTTAARADLLASLMVDGEVKATIAKRAGLQPNQLVATTSAATDPTPGATSTSATAAPNAYVLSTQVLTNSTGDQLPIIEVDTQAPNRPAATKLAAAATSGLADYLNSKAALERIPDAERLQVSGLGLPQDSTVARGPTGMVALIVFVLVFGLGCAGILGVLALIRGWRAASVREQLGDDALLYPNTRVESDGLDSDGRQDSDVVLMPDEPARGQRLPRLMRRTAGGSGEPAAPKPDGGDERPARRYPSSDNAGTLHPDSTGSHQTLDAHAQREAAYVRALRAEG
jgi:hypothetical protein